MAPPRSISRSAKVKRKMVISNEDFLRNIWREVDNKRSLFRMLKNASNDELNVLLLLLKHVGLGVIYVNQDVRNTKEFGLAQHLQQCQAQKFTKQKKITLLKGMCKQFRGLLEEVFSPST